MADLAPVFADLPKVAEESVPADALDARLRGADRPFVVRGLAADWPLVAAGREGAGPARDYLLSFARERDFDIAIGRPGAERVFYDDAMGMDFRSERWPLARAFDLLAETLKWCEIIKGHSPLTLRMTKKSLNMESDALYGSWQHGMELLAHVWGSEESLEGMNAFLENRKPDFQKFRMRNKKELEDYLDGCERDLNAPPSMRKKQAAR